jgi:hypothetical protein
MYRNAYIAYVPDCTEPKMPREGYRSFTVTEETYSRLERAANEEKRTMPNMITILLDRHENKRKGAA